MPASPKSPRPPKNFEEAIERLRALVDRLEEGDVPLEKSLESFEEGQMLISYCQGKLADAEKTLKDLAAEADEALGEENGEE